MSCMHRGTAATQVKTRDACQGPSGRCSERRKETRKTGSRTAEKQSSTDAASPPWLRQRQSLPRGLWRLCPTSCLPPGGLPERATLPTSKALPNNPTLNTLRTERPKRPAIALSCRFPLTNENGKTEWFEAKERQSREGRGCAPQPTNPKPRVWQSQRF